MEPRSTIVEDVRNMLVATKMKIFHRYGLVIASVALLIVIFIKGKAYLCAERYQEETGAKYFRLLEETTALSQTTSDCLTYEPGKMMVAVHPRSLCKESRLGNKMFMIASALGIACMNNAFFMLPTVNCPGAQQYEPLFEGLSKYVQKIDPNMTRRWTYLHERNVMYYIKLQLEKGRNYVLGGLRQNWKYFSSYNSLVRRIFEIAPLHKTIAIEFLHMVKLHYKSYQPQLLVGVHIRRGDLKDPYYIDYGFVMAEKSYFEKAFSLMTQKHKNANIIFVVASDTLTDAKEMLLPLEKNYNIYYSEGHDSYVDFTILSLTDHMITSGGTFGFWTAWLGGGDVIYFAGYSKPGSKLEEDGYCSSCAGLPHWIPLDN